MAGAQNRTQKKQMVIRMTESDYEATKKRVAESGMSQAEYLRQAILNKKIVSTEGMKAVIPELKRIGNNLNQIARVANEQRNVPAPSLAEIERIGKELDEAWRSLRRSAAGRASETP